MFGGFEDVALNVLSCKTGTLSVEYWMPGKVECTQSRVVRYLSTQQCFQFKGPTCSRVSYLYLFCLFCVRLYNHRRVTVSWLTVSHCENCPSETEETFFFSDRRQIPDFPHWVSTVTSADVIQSGHLTSDCVQHISGHSLACRIFWETFLFGRQTHSLCTATTSW